MSRLRCLDYNSYLAIQLAHMEMKKKGAEGNPIVEFLLHCSKPQCVVEFLLIHGGQVQNRQPIQT